MPFKNVWSTLLQERGGAPYMHMVDAIQHRRNFEGWGTTKTEFLIQGFLGLLQQFTVGKHRTCGFRCTVDLRAHEKWREANNIPPVAQLCANLSFGKMMTWYGDFPDFIISAVDICFDQGDPFLGVLTRQKQSRQSERTRPVWDLVRTIEPANMRSEPALQAADMLAWSHNRLKTLGDSGWAGGLARQIATSVQCWNIDLNEDILSSRRHRNKYGFWT